MKHRASIMKLSQPRTGRPSLMAHFQAQWSVLEADLPPDRMTQLEDLLGHVRRCERWARLDDRLNLGRVESEA